MANPLNALSIVDYGGVADWVSNASPGSVTANVTAFNSMASAAGDGQLIVIPNGKWGFNGNLILASTTKRFNLLVIGDLHFSPGYGMIVDGFRHEIKLQGELFGGNSGGVFSSYTGVGLYLRNAYNCDVRICYIRDFYVGLEVGGLSNGTNAYGSQYNKIWYSRIGYNYSQIDITAKGTDNQDGPWCNSNVFYGGQLGGGTSPTTGGNYGIRFIKGVDQGTYNYYNQNYFYHTGFEGLVNGIYAEHAHYNFFIGARFEPSGVTNKIYLSTDTASVKHCAKNYFIGILMYESYFVTGGYGIGTVCLGPMLTSDGVPIADISLSNTTVGKFYQLAGDYTYSGYLSTTNDAVSLKGFQGGQDARYQMVFKQDGVTRNIPFEQEDQTITAASATVTAGIGMVYVNYTGGTATVYLPTAASFPRREIRIKNLHTTNTVNISSLAAGEDNTVPGLGCTTVRSTGTTWVVVAKD
jgi:hypothetical protein